MAQNVRVVNKGSCPKGYITVAGATLEDEGGELRWSLSYPNVRGALKSLPFRVEALHRELPARGWWVFVM
ncbi:MAG TPA: hypothetical protein ENF46_00625 [Candidatus Acetothermia bacterium]|nr:hypothetical protein [Candidatus Acetothermia bacterium]